MKLTRKTVESASDVINVVEVLQIQYTDRAVDVPACVEDGDLHSGCFCSNVLPLLWRGDLGTNLGG